MRDALRINLQTLPGLHFTGDPINRLPHHISMLVGSGDDQPISGRAVVRELSRLGVATSSGSACMAGQPKNSAVLEAMQIRPEWLQSGLRFSLGSWLDETQLDQIPDLLQQAMIAAASPE